MYFIFTGFDLNLELSLHDQGVLEGTLLQLTQHFHRVSDPLPHELPISTQAESSPSPPTDSDNKRAHRMSFLMEGTYEYYVSMAIIIMIICLQHSYKIND